MRLISLGVVLGLLLGPLSSARADVEVRVSNNTENVNVVTGDSAVHNNNASVEATAFDPPVTATSDPVPNQIVAVIDDDPGPPPEEPESRGSVSRSDAELDVLSQVQVVGRVGI